MRENVRQQRKATKVAGSGGVYIDALTELQVDERADWTPERITARYGARPVTCSAISSLVSGPSRISWACPLPRA
jgi:hypothetical protein